METIVFATKNQGKLKEVKAILAGLPVQVCSMGETGVETEILEDGTTFAQNAMIKAAQVCQATGLPTLADDSGLEIDALDRQPGVYSARFLGEHTDYTVKNQYLIDRLAGVPLEKRTARFVCAIAAVFPDGRRFTTEGTIEGYIGWTAQGAGGFGYDPIFYLPGTQITTAQLSLEEKNKMSHRGKALRGMRAILEKELGLS